MAPVLSALWGAGVAGSGVAAATSLGNDHLVVVGTFTAVSAFILLSLLLLLCTSCQGQKKANVHPGDQENLMNGVSERETVGSQSVDSPGTDLAVSSSHNGPLTSGTVLTDTQDNSPQPSEEMLSSQSELRSSKCPQDRELPSIPPNSALDGVGISNGLPPPPSGDGTYEVVKERGAVSTASRDVSAEDSLYETVKELKDHPGSLGLPNGTTSPLSPDDSHRHLSRLPPALHNGHLSPGTPERGPLCAGVEYASVDLNKKSRFSADLEARRSATVAAAGGPAEEHEEEDRPPPVPEKVLDENDNHPTMLDGEALHNGQFRSSLSPSPGLNNHLLSERELSDLYSTVEKTSVDVDEKESDYSSIAEIKGLVPESSSSDLYATVREIYPQPEEEESDLRGPPRDLQEPTVESTDPGYETIRIPKQGSGEELGAGSRVRPESDYEELGMNGESSRL
ncbi:phosphoprotein associated with glycosphingolipid-enriched microdomains 1 [Esox lucius]|uniref:Phosphoprotein membrane anchor with glycosphingolipid microdomains 1 n=1 Tax=Esox lucius TaxID=8010 RepID=A0A3P8XFT7_ESOLU|nr:phosphoprotein associated with glycosphingolipid-enriched microdomains 1 [Esox lucius]XP_010871677.1 phosphoprotein associated with glycosphingolipid-enriched microdomains 1 [Esox lucius]XP_010871678.1 phosphoprotein associated with glycosphingolipid-enriched microdomains 1 [Esox lucius]XP_010871679.1 phosphoprotein associated with glycosphingolipid-enriched microdomains 1 [Esox lucius]XP_010871680.1 phosphoprotein associated with glycosphingolipid-enriched microdomains 1 [Esox lucius]XP_01